jgi:hypothetical protein
MATFQTLTAPVCGSGEDEIQTPMRGQQAAVHARSNTPNAADAALPMTLDMIHPRRS